MRTPINEKAWKKSGFLGVIYIDSLDDCHHQIFFHTLSYGYYLFYSLNYLSQIFITWEVKIITNNVFTFVNYFLS